MNIKGMQYLMKNNYPVPESMFLFRKKSDLKKGYREKYGQEKVWAVVGYDGRTKINDHPYKAKSIGRSLSISEKEIDSALIKADKALDEGKIPLKNRIYLTCKTHTDKNTILSGHAFFDGEKIHLDLLKGNRPSGKDWSPNRSYEIAVKNGQPELSGVDKDLSGDLKNICKDIIKMGQGAYLDFSKTDNGRLFYHDLYFMKDSSKAGKSSKIVGGKKILTGVIANKGKVVGTAFVVKDNKDIFKFKPGSILVTKMTNPSFVPAMMSASGIVTDIGGVTCHAAIISRELGLPCIVDTGDATKKIKTGQKIFLNASEGIVYEK